MAVSYPLKSKGQIVGALRLIASTDSIDEEITGTIQIFIAIGVFVVLIVGLLSIFLANTILIPLKGVTVAAEGMAAGDFQTKCRKKRNDEVGKLADTLNYMADEIIKRETLKNDFISSVSHELRTPLTSIKGWAITLQSENFQQKETLHDGLSIIEEESERLTLMVEELLDFSIFISGRINLENKIVNLKELLNNIRKQMAPRAERKNIGFTVSYPEELPDINSDANRLKQLFINILDNAFNFADAGGSVSFETEASGQEYIFTVSDSGCGISDEELPLVKEKFYKGKSSDSKNGIGLSICEEIVTLMNGSLKINSELDMGTVVTVTLPKEAHEGV
jgi:signal transduction histidine kinase